MNDEIIKLAKEKKFLHIMDIIFDTMKDAIVFVDNNGIIKLLSNEYCKFIGIKKTDALGKHVTEVLENTRMHKVVNSGKSEIADVQKINGKNMIATRIPIYIEGKKIGALGRVLFKDVEDLNEFHKKINNIKKELLQYKNALSMDQIAEYNLDNIITEDKRMIELKNRVLNIGKTNSNVLILGESGTGKELFAHSIYRNSNRSDKSFVKVNCSTIPGELLESELFGYEEGAFTGSIKGGKIGKFEAADGGVIFLDEIGDMALNMQSKLLRVLQEGEIEKIGSVEQKRVNVRVIAATNKNLEEMVEKGTFRLDLYYRLNVISIKIPPLRDRKDDIELLANKLLEEISEKEEIKVLGISNKVIKHLRAYDWPGNVRELGNIIERAINYLGEDTIIKEEHLSPKIKKESSELDIRNLKELLEQVEKEEIEKCLLITNGNKAKAAKILGISRTNLYKKIERYEI